MKIAVIGAGIVGICTAYELALDGHTVCVFERNAAVAEESSFACGGHISPSLAHPLAWPAWPQSSRLRSLWAYSGIALGRGTTLGDLRWLIGWKTHSKAMLERFAAAQSLAAFSQQRLQALSQQNGLAYEHSQGQLLLLHTEPEVQAWQERLAALRTLGQTALLLTPEEARKVEPALGAGLALQAAVHFPNDSVANCRQFAHALRDKAMALGVAFHFNTPVSVPVQGTSLQVHAAGLGAQDFEQVVLCAGAGAASLVAPALRLPLTQLWSYSLSAQLREPLNAPRSAVLEPHGGIAISRMGARIRITGGAELGSSLRNHTRKRASQGLYQTLQTHFPGAADFSRSIQLWSGASLFSPDALPLLGASGRSGLWLNLAHGHSGWSMACGAARALADQIGGRSSDVDTTRMQPGRFKT